MAVCVGGGAVTNWFRGNQPSLYHYPDKRTHQGFSDVALMDVLDVLARLCGSEQISTAFQTLCNPDNVGEDSKINN